MRVRFFCQIKCIISCLDLNLGIKSSLIAKGNRNYIFVGRGCGGFCSRCSCPKRFVFLFSCFVSERAEGDKTLVLKSYVKFLILCRKLAVVIDFRRNNISSHRLYFYVIFTNFEERGGYIMFDNIFICLCIFTNYSVLSSVVRWRIFFYCKGHTIVMVSFSPNQNMMRISWISRKKPTQILIFE